MGVELMESHKTVAEVSKELGVHKNLFYQWRSKFQKRAKHSFSGNNIKSLTSEETEIERLKKELREVEIERDILIMDVGIFSKSNGKNSNLWRISALYLPLRRCVMYLT